MKLRAVDLRDPALTGALRERLCWLYYDEIYRAAFPIADEAEDPSIWLPLIADTQPPPLPIVHLVLAVDDAHGPRDIDASALFGGIIFEYFRISKASLATYLCIKPEMRGHGVARFLIARALDIIGAHAPGVAVPLFAEAENPRDQIDAAVRDGARRRLPILSRLGFRKLPIAYRQPALGPGKRPLDNLEFLVFTDGKPASIKLSVIRGFMREFYDSLSAGPPDEAKMFGACAEDIQALDLIEPA